ncbi:MAG: peptidoglycan-binding domain-containing protein [Patescibacteria group bacterium]
MNITRKRFAPITIILVVVGVLITTSGAVHATSPVILKAITMSFGIGATDATTNFEVRSWQFILVSANSGPKATALKAVFDSGVAPGYFGNLTGAATVEWQTAHGISPTCPCVGPKTRAAIAAMPASTSLTLITPNGGEAWGVRESQKINWSLQNFPVDTRLRISLENAAGQFIGDLAVIRSTLYFKNEFPWTIESVVDSSGAKTAVPLGAYRIRLRLYDREPCTGVSCPTAFTAKVIAEDISEAAFTIGTSSIAPSITSIEPTSGVIPTTAIITVRGSGFTPTNNTIRFASTGEAIVRVGVVEPIYPFSYPSASSSDGKTLSFTLPNQGIQEYTCFLPECPPPPPSIPTAYGFTQGNYTITVTNANGISNTVPFTVTGVILN